MAPTAQPPQNQGQYQQQATFDMTGQVAPAGMKPRVTATLWEDEGSLCFQVEAKGVCVARREGTLVVSLDFCWELYLSALSPHTEATTVASVYHANTRRQITT